VADGSRPTLGKRSLVGGDDDPEVFCADEQSAVVVDLERWQHLVQAVLRAEGVRGGTELSVIFVSEDDITALNQQHMGAEGSTDVLAFPLDASLVVSTSDHGSRRGPDRSPPDPGEFPVLLGDVVLCPEVASRQAPEHAGSLDDELALLLVHGVLHVLGYDHDEPAATDAMRARERVLLEAHHWGGPAPARFRQEQP
jgi:probable rRNA maturation factor